VTPNNLVIPTLQYKCTYFAFNFNDAARQPCGCLISRFRHWFISEIDTNICPNLLSKSFLVLGNAYP